MPELESLTLLELKKLAIDEDTSLSGLIIKMIEEGLVNRNKRDLIEED